MIYKMFLITNILLYVLLLYECSGYISNQFFSYNSYTINSRNSNKNSNSNSNKNNKIYSDFFILPHSSYSYSIRTNNIYSNFFISHHNSYSYSIRTNNIYSNFFISHPFISHPFISHQFISHQFISHQFISHSLELKTCNNYLSIIDSYSQTKSATNKSIS